MPGADYVISPNEDYMVNMSRKSKISTLFFFPPSSLLTSQLPPPRCRSKPTPGAAPHLRPSPLPTLPACAAGGKIAYKDDRVHSNPEGQHHSRLNMSRCRRRCCPRCRRRCCRPH